MAPTRARRGPRGADVPRRRLSRERSARDARHAPSRTANARHPRGRRTREGHRGRARGTDRGPPQPTAHRADRVEWADPADHTREGHPDPARPSARAAEHRALPPAMTGAVRTKLGTGALVWAGLDGEHPSGDVLEGVRDGRIG